MGLVRESPHSQDRFFALLGDYQRRLEALEREVRLAREIPYFTSVRAAGAAVDLQRPGVEFYLAPDSWGSGVSYGAMRCTVVDTGSAIRVACENTGPSAFKVVQSGANILTGSTTAVHMSGAEIEIPEGIAIAYGWVDASVMHYRGFNSGGGGRSDGDVGFYLQNLGTYYATAFFNPYDAVYVGSGAGGLYAGGTFGWNASDGNLRHGIRRTFESAGADHLYYYGPRLAYYLRMFNPA